MAFQKRTWLARIGLGLNKFIIGAPDGQGKQTLTNSPDSITQQGDVISADNLNDLEQRIADGFNEKQDTLTFDNTPTQGSNNPVTSGGIYTAINNIGGIDIWTNTSPSFYFNEQTLSLNNLTNSPDILFIMFENHQPTNYRLALCPIDNVTRTIYSFDDNGMSQYLNRRRDFKAYWDNSVLKVYFSQDEYVYAPRKESAWLSGTGANFVPMKIIGLKLI